MLLALAELPRDAFDAGPVGRLGRDDGGAELLFALARRRLLQGQEFGVVLEVFTTRKRTVDWRLQ